MGMKGFILFLDAIFAALLVLTLLSLMLSFKPQEISFENYYYITLSKDFLEVLVKSGIAEKLINASENNASEYANIIFKEFSSKALLQDLQCKLLIDIFEWNGTNFSKKNELVFYYPGNEPPSANVYTSKKIILIKNSSNIREFAVLTSYLWSFKTTGTIISISTFLDSEMKYPSINFRRNDTVFYRIKVTDNFGNPIEINASILVLDPNQVDSGKGVSDILINNTYESSFKFEDNDQIGVWKIVVIEKNGMVMNVKQINLGG